MGNNSFTLSIILIITLLVASTRSRAEGVGPGEQQLWCVAKNNAEDSALQQALDWACGPGASDCGPIQQGGLCYDPTDLVGMASYAFNDYCVKHGMTDETCNFSNTAALTSLNPSHDKCKFASSAFSAANSTTPSTSGIIPGSSDVSGLLPQFSAIEIRTLALLNLLFTVSVVSL